MTTCQRLRRISRDLVMSDEQQQYTRTSRASSLSSPLDPVGSKSNHRTRMMRNENEYERNEDDDDEEEEEDYDDGDDGEEEEEEEPTTTAKIEYYYEDEGDSNKNIKRNGGVADTKIMKQYFLGSYPNDESESKFNEKKTSSSSRRNEEKIVDKHQRHRQSSSNREEKKLAIFFPYHNI